jgi:hydroxymethylpyrimidine/phosphomethylpyrimidine kinase
LTEQLIPIAEVITPNIPEAEVLSGRKIRTPEEMVEAARSISEKYQCNTLLKGGHQMNDANDLLYQQNGEYEWIYGTRVDNPNTHGTGCTLSSAIAANLAKGMTLSDSVKRAKSYLTGALFAMLNLGKGSGPMEHGFAFKGEFR